jgi:hypothetical protein
VTSFVEVPMDAAATEMNHREIFWELPDDVFREQFGGRLPSREEKLALIEEKVKSLNPERVFENDTYWVGMTRRPPFIHLDIRRHDGGTCKEWRDFQHIKNELVGPEFEAIELFPAESRLIDTANQYHLWVIADPKGRFAVGWWRRCVLGKQIELTRRGLSSDSGAGQVGLVHSSAPGITVLQNAVHS